MQSQVKTPYLCGKEICMGDIFLAPYFDRMCVLEHYRGFTVPSEYRKWHTWSKNLLAHPKIAKTRVTREDLIKYYENFANGTVRNKEYYTYYASGKRKLRDKFIFDYC
jgi:hypothetical protein